MKTEGAEPAICPLMLESLLSCVVKSDVSGEVDDVGKGDMARNEVCGEILSTTVQWAGLCARLDPSAHRHYPFVPGPDQLPCPHAIYVHGCLAWTSVPLIDYSYFVCS